MKLRIETREQVTWVIPEGRLDFDAAPGFQEAVEQRVGIPFALCALQPAVREVFDLSGFSRIIAVHADRAAALAHTQPARP